MRSGITYASETLSELEGFDGCWKIRRLNRLDSSRAKIWGTKDLVERRK